VEPATSPTQAEVALLLSHTPPLPRRRGDRHARRRHRHHHLRRPRIHGTVSCDAPPCSPPPEFLPIVYILPGIVDHRGGGGGMGRALDRAVRTRRIQIQSARSESNGFSALNFERRGRESRILGFRLPRARSAALADFIPGSGAELCDLSCRGSSRIQNWVLP
jgi:hypothetical protein